MNVMEARNLSISFGGVRALNGVGFSAAAGRVLSIIGPNGAGKTTLFNVASGLYRSTSGSVFIEGEEVTGLPPHQLACRGLSRTFQNLQIFDRLSVIANVMIGCHIHEQKNVLADLFGWPGARRETRKSLLRATEMLMKVGLGREADRPASDLSYGALKRLEIARALAAEPKILMLDEPAAGCNPREKQDLIDLIKSISDEGTAVVLVEHDMNLVMSISDDVLVLARGEPLAHGSPREVRSNPAVISAYLGVGGEGEKRA